MGYFMNRFKRPAAVESARQFTMQIYGSHSLRSEWSYTVRSAFYVVSP